MTKKFEYFFDILSPYSYLSWQWLKKNKLNLEELGYEIHLIPVTLATIIAHYKTLGPAQIGPKRDYLFRDILRYARLHGITFTTPKELPFNSLYGLRLSLHEVAGEFQFQVIDKLFQMGWSEGQNLGDIDLITSEFKKNNLPIDRMLDLIGTREIRSKLKQNVDYALSKEVFGLPSFLVEGELFWGNDSIKYLEMFINDRDPLDRVKYQEILSKHNFKNLELNN